MSERKQKADYTNELNKDLLQMLGVEDLPEAANAKEKEYDSEYDSAEEEFTELDELSDELPETEAFSRVEYLTPRRTQKSDKKSAKRQKSVSKKSGRDNQRTKHASPWKETAATQVVHPRKTTLKTKSASPAPRAKEKKKKHRSSGDMHFLLMSIGIAVGVLVTAGALVYISLLFLH